MFIGISIIIIGMFFGWCLADINKGDFDAWMYDNVGAHSQVEQKPGGSS